MMQQHRSFGPPIQEDPTEKKWRKGRELLETFLTTLPKRKSYNEWLLFLEKYLDHHHPVYLKWRIHFLVAKKIDAFGKGSPVDPLYEKASESFPRGAHIEDQWYSEFVSEILP